jgi:hypothetical protein
MTDEIAQLLMNLHLGRIAELLDKELANADKSSLGYQELLARLLRAQWQGASSRAWTAVVQSDEGCSFEGGGGTVMGL